ncbi:hypothetical protein AB4Z52_29980 [Rhizobium sp. 2YAF20]|uniref:hypothetical protein n=1 Tax=Rhizobium sp. 2YAF20 TaxID=3233027 RepID=UPI003F9E71C9
MASSSIECFLCILDMSDNAKPRHEHNRSKPAADVSFPDDRMTVEHFRVRFTRALERLPQGMVVCIGDFFQVAMACR